MFTLYSNMKNVYHERDFSKLMYFLVHPVQYIIGLYAPLGLMSIANN